ncbi:MAG TPA: exodeoxyribonuclease VII large subunit [Planctomycetota bacterium]|nr:exodeoxyribonuclease VII large subunit [Planctomycetota bacterium]
MASPRFLFSGQPEPSPDDAPAPLTVSELVARLKSCIQPPFANTWVAGEVTDYRPAASGHAYFALKDGVCMVRAKMWRSSVARLRFSLENGARVVAHGSVELYEARGDLSLVCDRLVPQGIGEAAAAFEQMRRKLLAEGLFAAERKRTLPLLPRAVGLVTSREGAAIRDFLRHLDERFPTRVVLAATPVQGLGADLSISKALLALSERASSLGLEAIALVRGGGGLEDLACFNTETVARAIAACSVPVVTGIGHEIDTTIADLVADRRAKTPTDAANVLVPDRRALAGDLSHLRDRLAEAIDRGLDDVDVECRREWRDLVAAVEGALEGRDADLRALRAGVAGLSPRRRVADQLRRFLDAGRALRAAARTALERVEAALAPPAARLESASPLAVLSRGYSIARRAGEPSLLTDASALRPGDAVETRLAHGAFRSRVESVHPEERS